MGIHGAFVSGVPMVVISVEANQSGKPAIIDVIVT
jgi:hypothetical protein